MELPAATLPGFLAPAPTADAAPTTGCAACLVPLHDAPEKSYLLPREGSITIGRRAANGIVCRDVAVSGQHCIVRKRSGWFEVEDCSTNGTYVNDTKLDKGQKMRINPGDLLTLTRPDAQAVPSGVARTDSTIQFRMDAVQEEEPPARHSDPAIIVSSNDLMGSNGAGGTSAAKENSGALKRNSSAPSDPVKAAVSSQKKEPMRAPDTVVSSQKKELLRAPAFVTMSTTAEGFAQDLLVQEQQSKAKITGELLLVRRRLDEERLKSANMHRELRAMRGSLDAERSRCTTAQAARDRLHTELEQLRKDNKELEEIETKSGTLQQRFDDCEVELGAQLQRATSLEAARTRLLADLEEARQSATRSEAQLTEVQTRLQQAQERAEQMQATYLEVRREAEVTKQNVEKLQVDVSSERAAREHLEDQVGLLAADAERAERTSVSVSDALKAATDLHMDLERRFNASKAETQAAREIQKASDVSIAEQTEKAARLRTAAISLTDSTREFMDQWARNLVVGGGHSDLVTEAVSPMRPHRSALVEEADEATVQPLSPSTPKDASRPSTPKDARPATPVSTSRELTTGDHKVSEVARASNGIQGGGETVAICELSEEEENCLAPALSATPTRQIQAQHCEPEALTPRDSGDRERDEKQVPENIEAHANPVASPARSAPAVAVAASPTREHALTAGNIPSGADALASLFIVGQDESPPPPLGHPYAQSEVGHNAAEKLTNNNDLKRTATQSIFAASHPPPKRKRGSRTG